MKSYRLDSCSCLSLCSISGEDLEITSRVETSDAAYCLKFDKRGMLDVAALRLVLILGAAIDDSVSHQAMSRGTKVVCKGLFQGLPVRKQVAKEDKTVTKRLNQVRF